MCTFIAVAERQTFWVEPEVKLAQNYGLRGKELQDARTLIEEHIDEIKTAWKKYFAS